MEISFKSLAETLSELDWLEPLRQNPGTSTLGEPIDCVVMVLEESDYAEAPQLRQKLGGGKI